MFGIIGAMEVEVEGVRALMTGKKEKNVSGIKFVSGKLEGKECVTAVCGIGKVFAAICAEAMILEFDPDFILNTGVAGSLDKTLRIADIVVADKVCQHDFDTSQLGDPKGLLSGINLVYIETDKKISEKLTACIKAENINTVSGTVASGDQFISSSEKKKFIVDNFGAKACEMESAAIGQVCYVNKVPFAILRAISDSADEQADMDFPTFCKKAAENYISVVKRFASEV